MEGIVVSGLQLFGALVLVALNGLFVAAEFAFTRLRSTRVDAMVREGKASARIVKEATENLDGYLAVCQVGITIASLGLGALGEPAIAALIDPLLASFLSEGLIHTISFGISFGIITFLHVVFGELAAKSVAIARAEGTSLLVAPFMKLFYYLFLPLVWFFNGTANAIVKLFGIPPASEIEERHTEEELHMLVSQSGRQGFLEDDEARRVKATFELDEKAVREIMISRPNVATLLANLPLRELVSVTAAGSHARYPIHEGDSPDRITGVVHVKDILRAVEAQGGLDGDVMARDLARDVLVIPENKSLDATLENFQEQELTMAVVVDEWGSFEGIVTPEDIFEEIVGEIRDEFDEEKPAVRALDDSSYSMDGSISLEAANEALDSSFTSKDFGTIGGLVLGQLGRAPEVDDEVSLDGHVLRVEEVDGVRVARVMARKSGSERTNEDGPDEGGGG